MAQGFVKSLNLLESGSESDAGIFENIGGAGIVPDLRLFSGNLRKTSSLLASEFTVVGDDVVVTGDGRVPFSNRTEVLVGSTFYTVGESNGIDRFKLYASNGSIFDPTGQDIIRSDAVSFQNLANMSVDRLPTNRDAGTGATVSGVGGGQDDETGIYDLRSISANYAIIEEGLGIYRYKKGRIPLTFEDSFFNRRVTFNGNIRITNDANLTQGPDTPGLFIQGPDGAVRAFSDTSNPWEEVASGAKLETTANNSSVFRLVLNSPNLIVPTTEIGPEATVTNAGDYTHKMKVEVNGEVFYALLTT